ncbi:MAG: S9 family peptidase [Gammaproteobacteria bacterium]|nr:S9 family peptidase [Gammaproteobacteria bacterium]
MAAAAAVPAAPPAATATPPPAAAPMPAPMRRAITHEDLWLMRRVGAPAPSPDGRRVVFSVTEPAYDEAAQVVDLWIAPTDGSAPPRRLTNTPGRESGVDWSPDGGRIAFAARRAGDDVEQIYVLTLAGGEAMRVTRSATGARTPRFAPDGRRIAYVSNVFPGATDEESNRAVAEERRTRRWNARIYEGFPIRNWDRWLDDRRPQLFVVDLPRPSETAAPSRNLLAGTALVRASGYAGREADTGAELDPVWAPDGRSLVFAASTDRDRAAWSFTSTQLWQVPVEGGEPRRLSAGEHTWSRPAFSADGRRLVALVERRRDRVYVRTEIGAFDWPRAGSVTGPLEATWLTQPLDRSISSFAVAADSRAVYALADEAGHEKLFVVPFGGGAPRRVFDVDAGVYANLAIAQRSNRPVLVGSWESATRPPEVVRIEPERAGHRSLSDFNSQRLAALDLPPVRHFWFTSSRGRRIHSLLVVPPGFDARQRYPLFNVIHGGPHTAWRDQWVTRWNYHLLGAPGYVVLLTNYSGSSGFGEAFAQHIQGDPLRTPGEELNEAADAAIREFPFIDASRQCAGGASYGGHLANWLQGDSRYRCLVSHAGLVNLESQWGTSDTVYGREINNGGPVWEQAPVWREQNPIRQAAQFRTPALVTIGEQDFRVPLNNALEYWTVLQRQRVPSRLVVFPDENHWILNGENSRLFFREVHAWLARWLEPPAPAAP